MANMDASGKQAAFAGAQATVGMQQLMGPQQGGPQQNPTQISEIPEEEVAPIDLPSQAPPPGVQP